MTYCDPTWWRCITAGKFMTQFPSQKPKNNSNNNNNDTLTDFEQTVREREREGLENWATRRLIFLKLCKYFYWTSLQFFVPQ